ncbi:MAG: serine/threonine protein kinase [Myxococcaceae bacterium]|nr:serine/threonine protein kinase [Myxococcaceae bacterium]
MLEPGTVIRDRYRITAPLARGGMGELYFAEHTRTGEPLVVKTLLSSLHDRLDLVALFFEEAELTARLCHPRIVRVFDYGRDEACCCFMAMERLEGATLGALMRQAYEERTGLSIPLVLTVGIQLCEALDHGAHAIGPGGERMALVHRDLSPLNIFVTEKGTVKLLDFGIARVAGASRHRSSPSLRGKPSYRSPEMVRSLNVDVRSDIFTLGVILWEALSGRKLFCSQPQEESERRILSMPIPRIARVGHDLPPALEDIVAKALSRDPHQRFQTAADFGQALRTLLRAVCAERQHDIIKSALAHLRRKSLGTSNA